MIIYTVEGESKNALLEVSQKSRAERDGVGCDGKRFQKRLWNKDAAASFGG